MHRSNVCNYCVVVTIAAHYCVFAQHGIKTYFLQFFMSEWCQCLAPNYVYELTHRFPWCDFTIFYKRKLADLHNFRFQSLHALQIHKLSNCCVHRQDNSFSRFFFKPNFQNDANAFHTDCMSSHIDSSEETDT